MKLRGRNGTDPLAGSDRVYSDHEVIEVEVVPEGAIVPADDGAFEAYGYRITNKGLECPDYADFDEWLNVGRTLFQLERKIQFAIGDWLIAGESAWEIDKEQVAKAVGRDLHTIDNYVWVARKIPNSLRREKLFFGHHVLVAKMDQDQMINWLNRACVNDWSVADMRHALMQAEATSKTVAKLAAKKYKTALNRVWRIVAKNGLPEQDDIERVRAWLDAIDAERKKAQG